MESWFILWRLKVVVRSSNVVSSEGFGFYINVNVIARAGKQRAVWIVTLAFSVLVMRRCFRKNSPDSSHTSLCPSPSMSLHAGFDFVARTVHSRAFSTACQSQAVVNVVSLGTTSSPLLSRKYSLGWNAISEINLEH